MEGVQMPFLPVVCGPCLATVWQCADNQALYTAILVFVVNLGLVHTHAVRRARVAAAFLILLSSSVSRERLLVIVEPRYVN